MQPVHEHDDYKAFIAETSRVAKVPLARIAEAAGVHRQYLTQVVKYKAHLSDEQAHRVGAFLGLRDKDLAYFLLLVQEAKTTHPTTRRYFEGRRAELRDEIAQLTASLPKQTTVVRPESTAAFADFYLDLNLQICHAHLFIPAYQREPRRLAERLRLAPAELDALLEKLLAMGLVEMSAGRVQSRVPFLHLEKDSLLSQQNHRNWRIYAAHQPVTRTDQSMFFSSTVTSELRVRKAFVGKLRALIAELHQELAGTKDEDVFQLNIDVFGL